MASFTSMFKRPRSKSEKGSKPPKVVFGDLDEAYSTIARHTPKGSPNTPSMRRGLLETSPASEGQIPSPYMSPNKDVSPSATLLSNRNLHLHPLPQQRGGTSPFGNIKTDLSGSKSLSRDILSVSTHHRRSSSTGDLSKCAVIEGLADTSSRPEHSKEHTSVTTEYPGLEQAHSDALAKLSGSQSSAVNPMFPINQEATIQNSAKDYDDGDVEMNVDICSMHGANDEGFSTKSVGQSAWSTCSSVSALARQSRNARGDVLISDPPRMALPVLPRDIEKSEHVKHQHHSTSSEEASRSSKSYGNTRRLLDLSYPQLPAEPRRDSFFQKLVSFAKEGQSSSERESSDNSFAKFSLEESRGPAYSRPISQGEFNNLQQQITAHLRRESRLSAEATESRFKHIGQISLTFPSLNTSATDPGPGSSQTKSSEGDREESVPEFHNPPVRTRNGTPPLLFGALSRSKTDDDWETSEGSNQLNTSIADCSDSASRGSSKSVPFLPAPTKVLKHPAHPRYNHSWDLQQDIRSGDFVLTPRYEVSRASLFLNNNAIEACRVTPETYAHPKPLISQHQHPFASVPPKLRSASDDLRSIQEKFGLAISGDNYDEGAKDKHYDLSTKQARSTQGLEHIHSETSSAWVSTTDEASLSQTKATVEPYPIPKRNPARQLKNLLSSQHSVNDVRAHEAAMEPMFSADSPANTLNGNKAKSPSIALQHLNPQGAASTGLTTIPKSTNGSTKIRLRSPIRRTDLNEATSSLRNLETCMYTNAASQPRKHRSHSSDEEELFNPSDEAYCSRSTPEAVDLSQPQHAISRASQEAPSYMSSQIVDAELKFKKGGASSGFTKSQHRRASISDQAAAYLRSKGADWQPTTAEMKDLIPPIPRSATCRSRPFASEPHPLRLMARAESPHLYRIQRQYLEDLEPVDARHRDLSRLFLALCMLLPIMLVPYGIGWLDEVMQHFSRGDYSRMRQKEKVVALVTVVCIVTGLACLLPFLALFHAF